MDLVKNCVIGQDTIVPQDSTKNLMDASFSLYFHVHPSIVASPLDLWQPLCSAGPAPMSPKIELQAGTARIMQH